MWLIQSLAILFSTSVVFVGIEGVGRGTFKNNDKSIRPPPGFRGTDGFTGM